MRAIAADGKALVKDGTLVSLDDDRVLFGDGGTSGGGWIGEAYDQGW